MTLGADLITDQRVEEAPKVKWDCCRVELVQVVVVLKDLSANTVILLAPYLPSNCSRLSLDTNVVVLRH